MFRHEKTSRTTNFDHLPAVKGQVFTCFHRLVEDVCEMVPGAILVEFPESVAQRSVP
jgi:hypothetical protein